MLGYIFDEGLKTESNERGLNCWDIYIQEILDQAGLKGTAFSLGDLDESQKLAACTALIVGRQAGERLSAKARGNLEAWVQNGGILIGFAVPGLDAVFGHARYATRPQQPDDYTISGSFRWEPRLLVKDIHPILFLEQRRLILSDIELIASTTAEDLAVLTDERNLPTRNPAVTWNAFGKGFAGYFVFDVAKTVWLLHQGRPTYDVKPEQDRRPGTFDLTVLGDDNKKVLYADELILAIANMVARAGVPSIYPIPPQDGKVPEALFYWGGDEYRGPTQDSLDASDFFRSLGLPYHINIEAEHHPITQAEFDQITKTNGHEISVYYTLDVRDEKTGQYVPKLPLREELYLRQSDAFAKRFGYRPVTSVNHCTRWTGWAEPARWMEKAGAKADNSFVSYIVPHSDAWRNSGFMAFGYGTGFPFFFYDNAAHANRRINVIEQTINFYESGHRASVRGTAGDTETLDCEMLHLGLALALRYHLVVNMFYHPASLRNACVREAIREITHYLAYRNVPVMHMGNDAAARWWFARSESTIRNVRAQAGKTGFETDCTYSEGMIVRVPWGDMTRKVSPDDLAVTCDGKPATFQLKREFGGNWLLVIVPAGRHRVEVAEGKDK